MEIQVAAEKDSVESNKATNFKSQFSNKILLIAGIAAVIAVMVVVMMWSQQPDYRVLFSNFSDKDGGEIVASLEQMNVPYKFSEGGTAILVPAAHVHQARLKIAAQGLPKGGNIGFELLENQKFGVSQFVEQVNFQRGLEGELERSVQSISAVQTARIHLAIPKPSVFVSEQQKPSASVLLNLHQGRALDQQQVSAIVHLVASSIPELSPSSVTIVDQNGSLLTDATKKENTNNLDPSQIKYVEELQKNIIKRVESIISPIVGAQNVHAEASADVDFSTLEQAAETYKPNQTPDATVIRSQQTAETQSAMPNTTGGVPGAVSNQPQANQAQPPANPTVGAASPAPADAGNNATPLNSQKNTTTNYEIDKTIRYTQQSMGGIKRLTVAVVVNYKQEVNKNGKTVTRPLTDAEKNQISDLAKQAMGFREDRGDSLSVVNSSFMVARQEQVAEIPLWKKPEMMDMAMQFLKYLAGAMVLFILYKKLLKPMANKLVQVPSPALLTSNGIDAVVNLSQTNGQEGPVKGYQNNLITARQTAKDNPRMVASVVTNWVNGND
ncbi:MULTISPECIES: flagellar basal-body MS-ring/collar protein FliF [Methylotenera]|uniref:flagellar basal-body MS-ring/collar protein FliF n=1 Tax=Methylotenera TaxID=359407 RepID=UPI0003811859|nr:MULTISPECIES: flagellar basal-body MS-ring/collar protein FliF [Methylotenera]